MQRAKLSVVVALGILGIAGGVAAWSRQKAATTAEAVPTDWASETSTPSSAVAASGADFAGEWRLDLERSDRPRGFGGRRGMARGGAGGHEAHGDRGWGDGSESRARRAGRALRGGDGQGRGMRRFRLPLTFRIAQAEDRLQIADSTGAVLQEIWLGAGSSPPDSLRVSASWNGQQLEIQRPGRREMSVRESWELMDGGQSLVIRTRFGREDDAESGREMKRVYRRVAHS